VVERCRIVVVLFYDKDTKGFLLAPELLHEGLTAK
jgi:hypothetical protein